MDFEKICMLFTMQEPYYGILLSSMNRVPTSRITTMGVGRSGNVFRLYYNPQYVNSLDVDSTLESLKHEVLHLALGHFTIFETPPETKEEQTLRNYAADLEVNCYINLNKMKDRDSLITCDKFGFPTKQGTRTYYKLLLQLAQQAQQQMQAQNPPMPCNGGQGGSNEQDEAESGDSQQQSGHNNGNGQNKNNQSGSSSSSSKQNNGSHGSQQETQSNNQQSGGKQPDRVTQEAINEVMKDIKSIDDHSDWPDDMSNEEQELIEQQVEDMLAFAADEVEKSRGDIPGEMVGKIEAIRNKKKPKPVADWKRYMRRYMGNEFSEFIRKSKKRESRRFPDAAGNRHRRKSHILVAIDTSGSVSMPEYQEFFGQIKTLTAVADFHVVECDAIIQYEYDYRGKPNMILHGGGGTSFQPPIDLFNKDKKKYDALIYFTDGEAWIPKDTPKDTLWVVSSQGDQSSRKKYQVNGASVAFIPKQK